MSWGLPWPPGSRASSSTLSFPISRPFHGRSPSAASPEPGTTSSSIVAGFLSQGALGGGEASPEFQAAGALSERLRSGRFLGLQSAFQDLPSAQQRSLRQRFGTSLNEFLSLAGEGDAEMLYAGLLNLGQRAQQRGDAALAGAIFQNLAEATSLPVPAALRSQAQAEFDAMRGVGAAGRRVEFLGRNFVREASDPGMILAMGVAGTVFSAVRLGALSRFAARPATWWTRGIAASTLASSIAFPAEVLSFWGANRAYGQVLRPESLRWDAATIGHELASLGLTLGLLKLSGAAAERIFDRVHGINPLTGEVARLPALTQYSRGVFQQAGMFFGIAGGHYLEGRLGLRPQSSSDTLWTDSLVTLFQFHIGGRLSQEVLGARHAALMQEMGLRTQALELPREMGPRMSLPSLLPVPALAPEGFELPIPDRGGPSLDHISAMSTDGPKQDGPVPPSRPSNPSQVVRGDPQSRPVSTNGPEIPFKALISSLFNEELSLGDRYQLSLELCRNLEVGRSVYRKLLQAGERFETEPINRSNYDDLDGVLHQLNRGHFEELSDGIRDWHLRFRHLQSELRKRVNQGGRKQRREIRRLLESVDLKMLETRRYHNDAESYLGDDKGPYDDRGGRRVPSTKSVFMAANYGRLVQRFSDISARLERYIQEKPPLERALRKFQPGMLGRRAPRITIQDMEAEIRRSRLPVENQDLFLQALQDHDILLSQIDLVPLSRWLRQVNSASKSRRVEQAWRTLAEYTDASSELHRHITSEFMGAWESDYESLLGNRNDPTARRALVELLKPRMESDPTPMVDRYLAAAKRMGDYLVPHRPKLVVNTALVWTELRGQLMRLRDRQMLSAETLQGLLDWFDPAKMEGSPALIQSIREDAMAGMIDFLRKGTHTEEIRKELSQFIGEVVKRRDDRMMEVLAIHFQNYQLGMTRDRLQIRNQPSEDVLSDQMAVEAYDRSLEAICKTARFYSFHREVRGPFFEVFEKMEGGKKDSNALLAAPILHRAEQLLMQGYHVDLLSRGGLGEAILLARHSDGRELVDTITSVLDLTSREHLEVWLDRAERELLHNGDYQRIGHNGERPLFLTLQIPRIRSGVSKRDLALWARDYLEGHSLLSEIHLVIPEKGNEAVDPLHASFFKTVQVGRSMPTSEALIENRQIDVGADPQNISIRLELYRLRQEWVQHLMSIEPDLSILLANPGWKEALDGRIQEAEANLERLRLAEQSGALSDQDLKSVIEKIELQEDRLKRGRRLRSLGEEISRRNQENWDLLRESVALSSGDPGLRSLVHRELQGRFKDLEKRGGNYLTESGLQRRGQVAQYDLTERIRIFNEFTGMAMGISLDASRIPRIFDLGLLGFDVDDLRWSYNDRGLTLQGDVVQKETTGLEPSTARAEPEQGFMDEPNSGFFSFRIFRESRTNALHFSYDHLTLPTHLQEKGVGTLFFAEMVHLARQLGAVTISSPDASGDHRYTMAVHGMRFKNYDERKRIVTPFQVFLSDYVMKIPELSNFDISVLKEIQTPQDIAHAHFNPVTRMLDLNPRSQLESSPPGVPETPKYYQVGRLFLLGDAPSYYGVFELKPQSFSMLTLDAYMRRRFGKGVLPTPEQN